MTPHPDLYLCNTHRHLLLALASSYTAQNAFGPSHPICRILYLEDDVPVPDTLRAKLGRICPWARVDYTKDKTIQDRFERLGAWVPSVIRRNLSIHNGALVTPSHWQGDGLDLGTVRFATGVFYHAGFFTTKVLAPRCTTVVLRESGTNNYLTLPVPLLKAILRGLSGRRPWLQIWGEEPWIDHIEVTDPDRLPARVRAKGVRRSFDDYMTSLPQAKARALAHAFLDAPQAPHIARPAALLLTQPIADPSNQTVLFDHLAKTLRAAGYCVWHKPHPREPETAKLAQTVRLPARFPIEAWAYCDLPQFDVVVALHSAALISDPTAIGKTVIQLLNQEEFTTQPAQRNPDKWAQKLSVRLRAHLDKISP